MKQCELALRARQFLGQEDGGNMNPGACSGQVSELREPNRLRCLCFVKRHALFTPKSLKGIELSKVGVCDNLYSRGSLLTVGCEALLLGNILDVSLGVLEYPILS